MRRVRWFAVLAFLFIPGVAQAIQLHWSSGADTLMFSEATRAILVLRADSAEVTLPPEWRLLWVGDSTEVEVVALDSLEVCEGDTAQVFGVDGPSTPDDSTAHHVTAHFCSGGSGAAEQATFTLDLPAWGRGKLKVVALDPADSNAVLESNEVTFNGGVSDPYPATILRASSTHHHGEFTLVVNGAGLAETQEVSVVAADTSWRLRLSIVTRSDKTLTARTSVTAPLPASLVEASADHGVVTTAALAADSFPALSSLGGYGEFLGSQDTFNLQPKDFSFILAGDTWHLFYIRRYQDAAHTNPDLNERNLGHATSTFDQYALQHWDVVSDTVLQVHPSQWDNLHVWAPSIILKGITYHMFYTGVTLDTVKAGPHQGLVRRVQRIGLATSRDLSNPDSLRREKRYIFSARDVPWAVRDTMSASNWEFRDPFVMEDPDTLGHYLMYYVTIDSASSQYYVGVARSRGDLHQWADLGRLPKASQQYVGSSRVESPHAFLRHGKGWLLFTANFAWGDRIHAEYTDTTLVNLDRAAWTDPIRLDFITEGQHDSLSNLKYWHASEHRRYGTHDFLAAFTDLNQGIDFTELIPPF